MQRLVVAMLVGMLAGCASEPRPFEESPVTVAPRVSGLNERVLAYMCQDAAVEGGDDKRWAGTVVVVWRYDNTVIDGFNCGVWSFARPERATWWTFVDICKRRLRVNDARAMLVNLKLPLPGGCERGAVYTRQLELRQLMADFNNLCTGLEPHAMLAQCYAMRRELDYVEAELKRY